LVKKPQTLDSAALSKLSLPLRDAAYVEPIEHGLAWKDIQWGLYGVTIRGKEYEISSVYFAARTAIVPLPQQ
jgi:hypothetical protein